MSTEARIGVVAGLFIVVVTSVYFFYGQKSQVDDVLVSATGGKSTPPKIPPSGAGVSPPVLRNAKGSTGMTPAVQPGIGASIGDSSGDSKPIGLVERSQSSTSPIISANNVDRTGGDSATRLALGPTYDSSAGSMTDPARSSSSPPAANNRSGATAAQPESMRGVSPRIGSPTQSPSGAASGDLSPSTWDRITESARRDSSPMKPTVPPLTPERDAKPVPSLAGASPELNLKAGTVSESMIQTGTAPVNDWPKRHTIVSGDTLIGLAFAYYEDSSRVEAILAANPKIKNPRGLKIGQIVSIPAPSTVMTVLEKPTTPSVASRSESSGLITLAGRSAPSTSGGRVAAPGDTSNMPVAARSYFVQKGDTFYSIAAKVYGDGNKWQRLFEANKSLVRSDPKRLRPGLTLTVPAFESNRP